MSKSYAKMQSWQVFHFARKHFGSSALYSLFGKKNARVIDYYCQDPKYTDKPEGAYNPIEGVKNLIHLLDDHGHCDVVRSLLAYLAEGTSCHISDDPTITELKPTMAEEILEDFSAVSDLQRAIEEGHNLHSIEQKLAHAKAAIDRTVAKYRETRG